MSHRAPEGAGPPSKSPHVVRVFRVETNTTVIVRLLAYSEYGLLTHYHQKRSVYCSGEDCPAAVHKMETFWKGYQPVELWGDKTKMWYPHVLEVTESLELDFRGVAARGQWWQLHRPARSKHKRSSLTGTYLESRDASKWPEPFDVLPILRTVFHCPHLALSVRNPMPARTVLRPSEDEGPNPVQPEPKEPNGPIVSFQERRKQLEASKNGH